MKKVCTLLLCLSALLSASAQNSYTEAIQQGDAAFKKGEYKTAINKYFAAEAFDPAKKDMVKAKVNKVFDRIEHLRDEAREALEQVEKEQKKTKAALAETKIAKLKADSALQKATKLISAFYFYDGQFALAYGQRVGENVFYFIDANGDEVSRLGHWEKAEQFGGLGFAKVKGWKDDMLTLADYLLDTLGNVYPVAYDIKDLTAETTALDLSDKNMDSIPAVVFDHKNLKVLLLNYNRITVLPAQIGQLTNLTILHLFENQLATLPVEIGQLTNLSELSLSGNELSVLPAEIGQLNKLTTLNLSSNQFATLPPEIGQLTNLIELGLSRNELSVLPAEIGQLNKLTFINLSFNKLTSLPATIGQLNKLVTLDLSVNKLSHLPMQIGQLNNLNWLNASRNQLTSLPPEIGQLNKVTVIELSHNQLTDLPSQIRQLTKLQLLDLSQNPIPLSTLKSIELLFPDCNIGSSYESLGSDFFQEGNYQEAYRAQKELAALDKTDSKVWFDLSFYALFAGQSKEAIAAAQKTLTLDPEDVTVETNLALGYLLDNQWGEAEKIYLKWKGKTLPNDARLWDEAFLTDIADLEEAGISHPDFEKVRQLFKD